MSNTGTGAVKYKLSYAADTNAKSLYARKPWPGQLRLGGGGGRWRFETCQKLAY